MKKTITFEQIIAAFLVNYKRELDSNDIHQIITLLLKSLEKNYEYKNTDINKLQKYITYNDDTIKIKDDLNLDTVVKKFNDVNISFTLKDALIIIAGKSALKYSRFIVTKSCLNCNNNCNESKIGKDENGFLYGGNCDNWNNHYYKNLILSKKER